MTVAGTNFTEVVFVEQIFVSVLITELREKLTYSLVADTRSQTEGRGDEGWMAGRMEYRKLPPHKMFPWTSYKRPKTGTDIPYKEEYTTRLVRIIRVFKNYWINSMSVVGIYGNEFCSNIFYTNKIDFIFLCHKIRWKYILKKVQRKKY
jgi:hypothetical protein